MSEFLSWFVQHPARISALAAPFLLLWLVLRSRGGAAASRSRALLYPVAFFLAFAGWEWLLVARSPEADIRVDLLLIWPVAAIVSAWALIRALRR